MKFSQFIDVFVAALYNEAQLTGKTAFRISEILERYGLKFNPNWRDTLFKDYSFISRVEARRHLGPIDQQQVSLSPDGLRWVEDELGENVTVFLEQNGVTRNGSEAQPAPFDAESFDSEAFDTGLEHDDVPSFESANWTGISAKLSRTELQKISELSTSLRDAIKQADLDDRTRTNALKHVEAVEKLLEAPDPPWQAIVGLLTHPVVTALLVARDILQIIWTAAR